MADSEFVVMAQKEIKMPKLGESIKEATVLNWSKKVGEAVEQDEPLLEVATDKVDSEIASTVSGILKEILFDENDVVKVGEVLAIIDVDGKAAVSTKVDDKEFVQEEPAKKAVQEKQDDNPARTDASGRFYSPLVRNMAKSEGISREELSQIQGSGAKGRVIKKDVLDYLSSERTSTTSQTKRTMPVEDSFKGETEIIEMDRMRSMIADHMVYSKHTSPHVTSYVEADVTKIVKWREKNKEAFFKKHGQKITFTPIFVEAVVNALQEFPLINVSVDGNKIVVKKEMNIGLATALPNGNLIVPVIKNANQQNLLGLTASVNDLVNKARTNKLQPSEIEGGTFTISNVGTFRNIMGTPIINQPEVAILATGAIRKRPAVVETEYGDVIAIRHMMYLSLSYDHRVVDGNLGGSFLARIGDYLEEFDANRGIG